MNRIVVGAHYGLRDWLAQRITAIVMAIYSVLLLVSASTVSNMTYDAWRGLFAGGLMRFATFVFFMCLFYHAWVGVRDIWMDYVNPVALRVALHVVTLLVLVGYAGWTAQILWRL